MSFFNEFHLITVDNRKQASNDFNKTLKKICFFMKKNENFFETKFKSNFPEINCVYTSI